LNPKIDLARPPAQVYIVGENFVGGAGHVVFFGDAAVPATVERDGVSWVASPASAIQGVVPVTISNNGGIDRAVQNFSFEYYSSGVVCPGNPCAPRPRPARAETRARSMTSRVPFLLFGTPANKARAAPAPPHRWGSSGA